MREPRLTASAEERLKHYESHYRDTLVGEAARMKFVPGEYDIELTASDIERAARSVRFVRTRRSEFRQFVLLSYSILGAFGTLASLFLNDLRSLLSTDPVRSTLLLTSLSLFVLGLVGLWYFTWRDRIRGKPLEGSEEFHERRVDDTSRSSGAV